MDSKIQEKHRYSNKSIFVIVVLIILVAVSFLFFLKPEEFNTILLSSKGLKFYKNEKLGFSFEYPKHLILKEDSYGQEFYVSLNASLYDNVDDYETILINKSPKEEYFDEDVTVKKEHILSNGIDWKVVYYNFTNSNSDPEHPYFKDYYFDREGLRYSIQVTTDKNFQPIRPWKEKVPLSFKLFKPILKDENSNWKTYSNNKYGFEFKYPPTYSYKEGDVDESLFPNSAQINFSTLSHDGFSLFINEPASGYGDNCNDVKKIILVINNVFMEQANTCGLLSYTISSGNNKFIFVVVETNDSLVKRVLSTFKFTK